MKKIVKKKNIHRGSDFDDFLKEEGVLEECQSVAIKRLMARELEKEIEKKYYSNWVQDKKKVREDPGEKGAPIIGICI